MVLLFNFWDRFVDPVHAPAALVIRLAAVAVILTTGIVQRTTGRVGWAPTLAKIRFSASVLAVAGANAVGRAGLHRPAALRDPAANGDGAFDEVLKAAGRNRVVGASAAVAGPVAS